MTGVPQVRTHDACIKEPMEDIFHRLFDTVQENSGKLSEPVIPRIVDQTVFSPDACPDWALLDSVCFR